MVFLFVLLLLLLLFGFLFGGFLLAFLFAFLFHVEAVFEFLNFVFVEFEFLAEVAVAAADAVGGRFTDGLLGSEGVAFGVFAGFTDGSVGVFFGFAGEGAVISRPQK